MEVTGKDYRRRAGTVGTVRELTIAGEPQRPAFTFLGRVHLEINEALPLRFETHAPRVRWPPPRVPPRLRLLARPVYVYAVCIGGPRYAAVWGVETVFIRGIWS